MQQDSKATMVLLEKFEKWYGEIHAVKNLDLEVQVGEAFVLLGSNGSGKSTILRSIVGLSAPSSGHVLVNGINLSKSPVQAKEQMVYLPQRVDFPGLLTGREILRFYAGLKSVDPLQVERALDFISLNEEADRQVRGYSGGMLQRLALGVTYLRDVPLLLLDEPTSNLDPTGIEQFREWIHELKSQGITILFTSHILQEALRLADRVGVMSEGRLVRVLEVAGFRDRVISATSVQVVLERLTEPMLEAAQAAGAKDVSCNDRSYSFKASPENRLKVIRAIEEVGGFIEELHTETPNWESLVEILSDQ
jgi:ABC-type multidrug transport system ATPase subunit